MLECKSNLKSLECLSLLLSTRKSLFSNEQKTVLLDWVYEATDEILTIIFSNQSKELSLQQDYLQGEFHKVNLTLRIR